MHLETIACAATASAVAGTAAAALAGDSLTIKNAKLGSAIHILALAAQTQHTSWLQLAFGSAHDTTRGYRTRHLASNVENLMPAGVKMTVQPQELLALTISGAATAGDVDNVLLWLWYEDLPGVQSRNLDAAAVRERIEKLTTVDTSITTTAGPAWTGAAALNAASDLLLPNRDYAVLGVVCDVECGAIGLRSPDWGNVRVGVPGNELQQAVGADWFMRLSRSSGLPCVPVLNSGNRAGIWLDACTDENAAAVPCSVILGLLRS